MLAHTTNCWSNSFPGSFLFMEHIMNKYYTYVYLHPEKPGRFTYGNFISFLYEPFYVGKGTNKRMFIHIRQAKGQGNYERHQIIRKLIAKGCNVADYVIKMEDNLTNECACCKETFLITLIGRKDLKIGPLTNSTGGWNERTRGYVYTEEVRRKMSEARKGKKPWNTGKKYQPTENQRKFLERLHESNKGKRRTEETKKLMSESRKGLAMPPHTEEAKRKISETMKGRPKSEETKEKMRNASRKRAGWEGY